MRELREELDLSQEPRGTLFPSIGDELDGDYLTRDAVARTEDSAHAPLPDLLLELEPIP